MKENLHTGDEARAKLIAGANKVADAVKGTLGAAGYNAIIEKFEYPFYIVTNDGVSIAREINLEDPVEMMGANVMKEIATRSDKHGGDGTTTAVTLAQAIIKEGATYNATAMDMKRSLEECIPIIEAALKDQTKEITVDDVGTVASVSAEDPKIGALIQEIYQQIGKDGILYPDVSKTFDDHYSIGSGVKVDDAGLVSPYLADVDEKTMQPMNAATARDATVLITKQKLTNARRDLETIIGQLVNKNVRDLVMFCDEMEPTVIPDLVTTRFKNGFRVIAVKLPTVWKDQWFEDLAKLTGATVIDPAAGLNFQQLRIQHLGKVGSFLADKNNSFLDGTLDISDYIKTLSESDDDESKIRAARLNTKTARLFVGAPTDAALSYKRLKVEDARNAAYQALHGGVVAGGGVALLQASLKMPDTLGGNILRRALKVPMWQIIKNAGAEDGDAFIANVKSGDFYGYDVRSGKYTDMWAAQIVDPASVTMSSVRNAISVAATILTARVGIEMEKVAVPAQMGPSQVM